MQNTELKRSRWQLLAASALLVLWMVFLLTMAFNA